MVDAAEFAATEDEDDVTEAADDDDEDDDELNRLAHVLFGCGGGGPPEGIMLDVAGVAEGTGAVGTMTTSLLWLG